MGIRIEKTERDGRLTYWLTDDGEAHPYGYVERVGHQWWATVPGSGNCGYYQTRSEAIASIA